VLVSNVLGISLTYKAMTMRKQFFQNKAVSTAALSILTASLLVLLPATVRSEEFSSFSAHQHGHAIIGIALDGEQLFIELTAPAMDIFGIERKPTEVSQIAEMQAKAAMLKTMQWLSLPTAAGCSNQSAEVMSTILPKASGDEISQSAAEIAATLFQSAAPSAKPDGSKKHDHDAEHDHDVAHEHEHSADDAAESHNDVLVSAIYRCTTPEKLSELSFKFWQLNIELQAVNAQWILPSGQGAATANKVKPTITFKP
jgi:hypothetical protein